MCYKCSRKSTNSVKRFKIMESFLILIILLFITAVGFLAVGGFQGIATLEWRFQVSYGVLGERDGRRHTYTTTNKHSDSISGRTRLSAKGRRAKTSSSKPLLDTSDSNSASLETPPKDDRQCRVTTYADVENLEFKPSQPSLVEAEQPETTTGASNIPTECTEKTEDPSGVVKPLPKWPPFPKTIPNDVGDATFSQWTTPPTPTSADVQALERPKVVATTDNRRDYQEGTKPVRPFLNINSVLEQVKEADSPWPCFTRYSSWMKEKPSPSSLDPQQIKNPETSDVDSETPPVGNKQPASIPATMLPEIPAVSLPASNAADSNTNIDHDMISDDSQTSILTDCQLCCNPIKNTHTQEISTSGKFKHPEVTTPNKYTYDDRPIFSTMQHN